MSEILRLKDTQQHDPRIDDWLAGLSGDLGIIAREATYMVRFNAEGGGETMHDGRPVICIDGAAFAYIAMGDAHVRLGFFHGAALHDPQGLLKDAGGDERYIELAPRAGLNAAAIGDLIQAAYDDMSLRSAGTH